METLLRKLIPLYLSLAFLPVEIIAQEDYHYQITGELKGLEHINYIYIKTAALTDSVAVLDNKFNFEGTMEEPGFASLAIKTNPGSDPFKDSRNRIFFFLSSGKSHVEIKDSIKNANIQSIPHQQLLELQKKDKELQNEIKKLWSEVAEFQKKEDLENASAKRKEAIEGYQEKLEVVYGSFIKKNPSSPIVIWALNEYAGWMDVDYVRALPLFNSLPEEIKKWPSAKILKDRLESAKNVSIGNLAPDFVLEDQSGKPVKLSDLSGKIVLIEFWASWCGPCRKENPNLVRVYKKFHKKGFETIGVSLDEGEDRDKWLKAIEQDKLPWIHVNDLKGFEGTVAKLYGIKGIPSNVLVDREGRIIAKNLNGETLNKKLTEHLK